MRTRGEMKSKRQRLVSLLLVFAVLSVVTGQLVSGQEKEMPNTAEPNKTDHNRLIGEKSPYLLQHADNPVDWYPWGEEAFEKARREDKPIFLSLGYSTCHWCHVMEQESFEDPGVAELMNEVFVSIKVDREERPDLDNIYMAVCQMLTGGGGWPLTIIMTPDKKPFFAATYIPRESKFGRSGMLQLIPSIKELWITRRQEVLNSAKEITKALGRASKHVPGEELNESTLQVAYQRLRELFDEDHGGFGEAPKFPTSHNLLFLLRYWKRTGEEKALQMVEKSLQSMRRGGIYDHLGFGFHRYSTDAEWFVPHFEKMLYDQALLSMAYTEAYQATGSREYQKTAREIFTYILRDMTSSQGGFYSAEDADSEGEEGKFYFWTQEELQKILAEEESQLIIRAYNVKEEGNLTGEATGQRENGNLLYMKRSLGELAAELKIPEEILKSRLEIAKQKLFPVRERRIRPFRDNKILTDWNGLMIAALAKGARVFDEPHYLKAAETAIEFILDSLQTGDGRLLHRFAGSQAGITASIEDYAFLIWGLIELYETTFEPKYLQLALDLNQDLLKHFWDEKSGGLYFTPDDSEELIVRRKEIYDGAIPSGNSVAMLNLLRLGHMTENPDLEQKAAAISRAFSRKVSQFPAGYTQLMVALDFALGPSSEVVIVGDSQAEDTNEMIRVLRTHFIPNKVVLLRTTEVQSPEIAKIAPYTKDLESVDGKATAYVCRDYHCHLPTTDVSQMLKFLNQRSTLKDNLDEPLYPGVFRQTEDDWLTPMKKEIG